VSSDADVLQVETLDAHCVQVDAAKPASRRTHPQRSDERAALPLAGWVREPKTRRQAFPLRTSNERADERRADCCFALAEQSSQEAGPAQLVLVRCGHEVSGDAGSRSAAVGEWLAYTSGRQQDWCPPIPVPGVE